MEMLPLRGLIGANIWVGCRETEIADVTQHMFLGVLRAGRAEICPDTPVSGRAIRYGSFLDG